MDAETLDKARRVLETYDVAALIVAADLAAKTAIVELIELRLQQTFH